MEIFINNQKLDFQLENEKNLKQIIDALSDWLITQGKVIDQIIINEKVYNDEIEKLENFLIEDTQTLKLIIIDIEVLVKNSLSEVKQYLTRITDTIYSKKDFEIDDIEKIINGLEWVDDVVSKCDKIYKYSENFNDREFNFNEEKTKLINNIKNLKDLKSKNEMSKIKKFLKSDILSFINKYLLFINKLTEFSTGFPKAGGISREKISKQLYNIINKLPDMIKLIDATVIELQSGLESEAMKNIQIIIEALQSVVELLQLIKSTLSIDFNKLFFKDSSIEEFNNNLKNILLNIANAMENRDNILLADLLEYELTPKLENYIEILKIIAKEINLDIN